MYLCLSTLWLNCLTHSYAFRTGIDLDGILDEFDGRGNRSKVKVEQLKNVFFGLLEGVFCIISDIGVCNFFHEQKIMKYANEHKSGPGTTASLPLEMHQHLSDFFIIEFYPC